MFIRPAFDMNFRTTDCCNDKPTEITKNSQKKKSIMMSRYRSSTIAR